MPDGRNHTSIAMGLRIRAARTQAGLSQSRLADMLDTTQSAISVFESGQRPVSIDMLRNMSMVLNQPLDRLVGQDGEVVRVEAGDVANFVSELEQRPEDIPELLNHAQFLRWRRTYDTAH